LKCLEDMKKSESKYFLSGHNKPLTKKALDFMTGYLLFLRQNIDKYQEEGLSYDQIKDKLNSKAYSDLKMSGDFHNRNIYRVFLELQNESLLSP
ncbi:MAG: MBL fold metallo-hydrolase, partial [Spirochaetota bacterium]|nr:MBL fold metallo-hydrolase [Spirochaetota bacterium]